MAARLRWYARRLARMSPAEIAWRGVEQARRSRDTWRKWRWAEFGRFDGPLAGLPGLDAARAAALKSGLERGLARICERRFRLLNQDWPATSDWNALWYLDPVTGTDWPGKGVPSSRIHYHDTPHKGDVKFVWELNRLQFLPVLALGGEWALVSDVLESWMDANPPFDGVNWTSAIEAATRVVSLLAALAFAGDTERARLDGNARAFLEAHLFRIRRYPSLYSSANNHRVAELAAQLLAGLCAPGIPDAATLIADSRRALEERMQQLFWPDGVGAEQSTTYASYALEWFAIAGIAGDATGQGFSETFKARAGEAAAHLRWLMDDGARVPHIGDGDETRVLAFGEEPEDRYAASVVSLVARWLGRPDLVPPAKDDHLRDCLSTDDTPGASAMPEGIRAFEQGGLTVARLPTSRGTRVAVFDHGPLGFLAIAAHGHADALSHWLHWGHEPVFVDAGTFLYHSAGTWRDRFRATPAHNTVSIDGADQSVIAGPFNWSRHARAHVVARESDSVTAEHDGYRRRFGVVHRRMIRFEAAALIVEDRLIGRPARMDLLWDLGFTVNPGIAVAIAGLQARLTTQGGRNLRLILEAGPPDGWHVDRAPFSPSFNIRAEADRLRLRGAVTEQPGPIARMRIEFADDA